MNHEAPRRHDAIEGLLPAYVNHTLDERTTKAVTAHCASCDACRSSLAEWEAVAGAAHALSREAPSPSPWVMARVWATIDRPEGPPPSRQTRRLWQVLRGQMQLVQSRLWLSSALIMFIGFVVAARGLLGGPSVVLQVLAPIVAAAGVSLVYGLEVDPGLELALATPTSPRIILLARLTLVFGYDLILTVVTTLGLAALGLDGGFWSLSLDWLGPMLLLSSLALVVSLRFGPTPALAAALLIWTLRVFVALGDRQSLVTGQEATVVIHVWSTNVVTVLLAAILAMVALRSVGHVEPTT